MSYIKCQECNSEYNLQEIKYPNIDKGNSVECTKCRSTLYSWDKGTTDYILMSWEKYLKNQDLERRRREKAPTCPNCNKNMQLKYGSYGWFWGCTSYPKCYTTLTLSESDNDLIE